MAPLKVLTQEALDMLDSGICVCTFNHPKYEILMLWFTEPRHPEGPPSMRDAE